MTEISGGAQLPFYGEVPAENVTSTLENYQPNDEHQQYALDLARTFVETDQTPAGLLLTGAPGNGKTHLAVGIGRAAAERGNRAAFIRFNDGLPSFDAIASIPNAPIGGWWDRIPKLTNSIDVLIVDDVPGSMAPGARGYLQQLVLAYNESGKKLVMTSNQSPTHLVTQISERAKDSIITTDKSTAVAERILQTYKTVEFTGLSYRDRQPKWWDGVEPPVAAPQSTSESQLGADTDITQLFGRVILQIAEAAGVQTTEVERLAEFLVREQNT